MNNFVYTGADPGLHGCVVALKDESDAPVWWYHWKSAVINKEHPERKAERFSSIENRLNHAMLESGLYGDRNSRHLSSIKATKLFMTYDAHFHQGLQSFDAIATLIKATGCMEATLSRFGGVFHKTDTTSRKIMIGDGSSNKFSKIALALTLQSIPGLESQEFKEFKIITTQTNPEKLSAKEMIALDFFDALAIAYICRAEWRFGKWFDLSRMKEPLACKLHTKRIYTSKELKG